jgi:hypothetical protein
LSIHVGAIKAVSEDSRDSGDEADLLFVTIEEMVLREVISCAVAAIYGSERDHSSQIPISS